MDEWTLANALKQKPANFNRMTMDVLKGVGWTVGLTQSFNHMTQHSKDLFGCADIIAFNKTATILVQACGSGDRSKRWRKVLSSKEAESWVDSNHRAFWVAHWVRKGQWKLRIEIAELHHFKNYREAKEVPPCQVN